jgi:cytochrome o ubiquinol oxidase subunit III
MSIAAAPDDREAERAEIHEQKALGFWLYLMGDAVIFSLLFATYAVMVNNSDGGPTGRTLFNIRSAGLETILLLVSSTTFGFASIAMRAGGKAETMSWLLLTFALGLAFVGLEMREFHGMVQAGAGPDRSGFLSAFFTLVGTHGLHVSIGLVWILILAGQVMTKGLTAPVTSRLFRLGLLFHFLDLARVGIFSIVYLPGLL